MKWVWEHPDWPNFTWDRSVLRPLEERFLHESGRRIGAWRQLTDENQSELRVKWLSGEAVETSAIEGEILDRKSVQSSILRRFGLTASQKALRRRKKE